MVPSYDQMGDWLEEICEDFPDAFFIALDGGIQLNEEVLTDPDFPPGEMFIMGQYCRDLIGRSIVLYYGSFVALLSDASERKWKREIFNTVAHEFRHHLEDAAMLHDLDDEDDWYVAWAKERSAKYQSDDVPPA